MRRGQSAQCRRQLTVTQAAAALANQHFIFPVNTYTDVTTHSKPEQGSQLVQ